MQGWAELSVSIGHLQCHDRGCRDFEYFCRVLHVSHFADAQLSQKVHSQQPPVIER